MKVSIWIIPAVGILFMLSMFWVVNWLPFVDHPYINRLGPYCEQNFSRSYGAFQSCGELMSDDAAKIGLHGMLIGLPLIAFVILPGIRVLLKKEREVRP